MPLTLNRRSTTAARVRTALLLRKKIEALERRFARTIADLPKNILARNVYGFNAGEMRKIAQNLHAKAKEAIASGHARRFRGSIEEAL